MSYFEENDEGLSLLNTFPPFVKQGIIDYIEKHSPMGGFLTSLFSNDLFKCIGRADWENKNRIGDYVHFIHWHCPSECHGSYEKVRAWTENKKYD